MSFDAALLAGYALATSTSAAPGALTARAGGQEQRTHLLVDATAAPLVSLPGRTAASTRTNHAPTGAEQ